MSADPATMEEMDVFVAEVRGSLESNQVKVQYKYRAAAKGKRKPGEWVFEGLVDASETAAAAAQFFVVQIRDEDGDMAVALVPQKDIFLNKPTLRASYCICCASPLMALSFLGRCFWSQLQNRHFSGTSGLRMRWRCEATSSCGPGWQGSQECAHRWTQWSFSHQLHQNDGCLGASLHALLGYACCLAQCVRNGFVVLFGVGILQCGISFFVDSLVSGYTTMTEDKLKSNAEAA